MRTFDYCHLPQRLFDGEVGDTNARLFECKGKLDLIEQLHPEQLEPLRATARMQAADASTRVEGLYVGVSDWNALRPTEISFYMMKLACKFNGGNVFARADKNAASLFNKHVGSREWWAEISTRGASADAARFVEKWEREAKAFRRESSKFFLYK